MLGNGESRWEDQQTHCDFSIVLENGNKIRSNAWAAPIYVKTSWLGKIFDDKKVIDIHFHNEWMKNTNIKHWYKEPQ